MVGTDADSPARRRPSLSLPRRLSPRAVAALATLLGYALRVHHLALQSFWRDEIDAVTFAQRSLPWLLGNFLAIGQNGPLYFLLLHYWIEVAGSSDWAVRYSSVLAGVATIPLIYVLGRRLFGPWPGSAAALLLAVSPYHLWYSQEAKMYAAVALVGALSVGLLLRALAANRWRRWLAWLVVVAAGLYLHFFVALLIGAEVLAIVVGWRRGCQGGRKGVWLLLGLALAELPLGRWELPVLWQGLATSYAPLAPGQVLAVLLAKFSLGLQPPTPAATIAFAFLLLAGLGLPLAGSPGSGRIVVAGWLVVPLALALLLSLRVQLFLDRYLIFLLPAYLLALGRGLLAVGERSRLAAAALVGALTLFWWRAAWSPPLVKQDFKDAVAYVDRHAGADDTLVFVPAWERQYFDYYRPRPYRWIAPAEVDQDGLASAVGVVRPNLRAPGSTLWLVSVEPQYGDRRQQLQHWLDRHAALIDDVPLPGLDLRRYRGPVH
jgi:mannosyltransferase